jgi:hypothetical protein
MNKLFVFIMIAVFASCSNNDNDNEISFPSPKELSELKIKGKFYNGVELEKNLKMIVDNSEVDTFTQHIFNRIEYYDEKYNAQKDQFGLTQIPSNFLFTDLNDDNIEDLIFQSNGPFIFDSSTFIIYLSENKNSYKRIRGTGQLTDAEIIEEFCCATSPEKNKYLKIEYNYKGCCDNPWDQHLTGILNLGKGLFSDELYTISLKAINRNAARKFEIEN